ncbi:MAG: hypothetical protein PHN84_13720 [Desulfuromonadaceae bacterium]|nr:hypothetical protein [Desulfuromonadaceae bacterium]MDD2856813.1 hypothetical protein [Desulfuromonadaceae bacterium]
MAKFTKGNKASPGRPPGVPDKRTELRQLLQPHAKDLLQKAVDLALDGDLQALRLCIDRLVPTLKATAEPAATALPTTGTLSEQAAAVYQAATTGKIDGDQAQTMMSLITAQIKIKELSEMEERLTALEAIKYDKP